MKFQKTEDPENRRKKTLISKRKRDSKLSQSQKRAKDNKDTKRVITNGRLTVPHVQTGIFLKGKSTVSYQKVRVSEAKLNALNKARMNENLAEILKFAKNSDIISVIPHGQENGGKSKRHPHPGDIEEVESSLNISPDLSKNTYGRNPYKHKFEIFLSSEDSSEEEKNEPQKDSKIASQNGSTTQVDEDEEEEKFDGESEYIDFKRFLGFFDAHVPLEVSQTVWENIADGVTMEKKDLKRKLRKINSVISPVNSPRNEAIKISSKSDDRFTNEQNKIFLNSLKLSRNIKTKTKIPKRIPNNYMCPTGKPPKMTIIKQVRGHDVIEASHNSPPRNMLRKFITSKQKFEKDVHIVDSLSTQDKASPIKHSLQNTIHPDSSSMLDPLHFLEVTMSQPEVTRAFSECSETSIDPAENLNRSATASVYSAPADLCEETPMPHFQENAFDYLTTKSEKFKKKEIFYDLFNSCKINEPSPSNLNCQTNFSSDFNFICHETDDIWEKGRSNEDLFDGEEKSLFPTTSQNFVFSPEITNDSTKEQSSPYSNETQGLKRLHMQSKKEASSNKFFDHEKHDRFKISRESFVLSPYHPKIDLSPKREFKEPEIHLENFWPRRKMF